LVSIIKSPIYMTVTKVKKILNLRSYWDMSPGFVINVIGFDSKLVNTETTFPKQNVF